MKENVLFVLKEVLICLGLVVIALGLNAFLFKDYLANKVVVQKANTDAYASVDRSKYIVINADIQDEQNPTKKYETVDGELDIYTTELRYIQGTINPFVSAGSISDIPTETIGGGSGESVE